MLYALYTTPTASNNKIVSTTTNCLSVIFIGQHPGGENPHRPGAQQPMGAIHGDMGRQPHITDSLMQTRCQEKNGASDSVRVLRGKAFCARLIVSWHNLHRTCSHLIWVGSVDLALPIYFTSPASILTLHKIINIHELRNKVGSFHNNLARASPLNERRAEVIIMEDYSFFLCRKILYITQQPLDLLFAK